MTVKELVLNGLEPFESYKIQHEYYEGKAKETTLTKELYLEIADKEIDSFYLDMDENKQPYISMKLV